VVKTPLQLRSAAYEAALVERDAIPVAERDDHPKINIKVRLTRRVLVEHIKTELKGLDDEAVADALGWPIQRLESVMAMAKNDHLDTRRQAISAGFSNEEFEETVGL
jgi:hypothetical protein